MFRTEIVVHRNQFFGIYEAVQPEIVPFIAKLTSARAASIIVSGSRRFIPKRCWIVIR